MTESNQTVQGRFGPDVEAVLLKVLEALEHSGDTARLLTFLGGHPSPDAAIDNIFKVCNEASGALRVLLASAKEAPVQARPDGVPAEFVYTNWEGRFGVRHAIPIGVRFDATEWHKVPQWLVRAWDTDKDAERDFALVDFGYPGVQEGGATAAQVQLLLEAELAAAQAAVRATIPLEAMTMSGTQKMHSQAIQDGMAEGIVAVRKMALERADRAAAIGIDFLKGVPDPV